MLIKRLLLCLTLLFSPLLLAEDSASGEAPRLLIKTSATAWPALNGLILRDHAYDEPALWAVEMTDGSESFLNWIDTTATG